MLSHEKTDLESRQILLEATCRRLNSIRYLSGIIPSLNTDKFLRKKYTAQLISDFHRYEKNVYLLKTGGVFDGSFPLDLPHIKTYEVHLQIQPFPLEVITPVVHSLHGLEKIRKDNERMLNRIASIDFHSIPSETLLQLRRSLTKRSQKQIAFFRQTTSRLNSLFYINHVQLKKTTDSLRKNQQIFRDATLIMSLLLILLIALVGLRAVRRIHRLNRTLHSKLVTDSLTQTRTRVALKEEVFNTYSIIYLIDIDDFSSINSLYGTEAGDLLLREMAERLLTNCSLFKIHRFGGDVFGLLSHDLRSTGQSIRKQLHYIENLIEGEKFTILNESVHVGITIGVGVGIEAIAQAMLALNLAKEENKPYKIYSRRNRYAKALKKQRMWKQRILSALQENRVLPFVQPIVDRSGRICHYECLMRIAETDKGTTTYLPPVFLEASKKTKLYPRLSRRIIQKSFEMFQDGGSFSINLSYLDIKEPGMQFFLEELIERYKMHGRVMFELLEHESLDDIEHVKKFLEYFRRLGVQIAIDDFGSQYSNLMEVIRFRPDYLKIDGSMIRRITSDDDARLAAGSITEFAHKLGIKTIAEYVSDRATYEACLAIGIDCFQGYFFSEPHPTTKAVKYQMPTVRP